MLDKLLVETQEIKNLAELSEELQFLYASTGANLNLEHGQKDTYSLVETSGQI